MRLLRPGGADGFVALAYKLVEAVLSFGLWFCLLLFPKGGGAGLAAALSPTSCDVPAIGLKWAAAILANSRYIGHCSSGLKWNFGAFGYENAVFRIKPFLQLAFSQRAVDIYSRIGQR